MIAIRKFQGALLVGAVLLSMSCGSTTEIGSPTGDSSTDAPTSPPNSRPSADSPDGVPVRIVVGPTTFNGRLNDTSTARALAAQLPLTLPFRDLMGQEKVAELPEALPLTGVPEGDDPVPGDIGYWVPDRRVVLYYGDVGNYSGIVRIGSIDGDLKILRDQSDGFTVTLARAD
jgi:hypothetical protein